MRLELFKCEECEETHNALYDLPYTWIKTRRTYQGREIERHFCSVEHLKKHFGMTELVPQPLEQPTSKTRRFILVDENAEEAECVLWKNGCVSLDPEKCGMSDVWFYRDWDEFKAAHPGCGVTWIDQEVKEEEMSHAAD